MHQMLANDEENANLQPPPQLHLTKHQQFGNEHIIWHKCIKSFYTWSVFNQRLTNSITKSSPQAVCYERFLKTTQEVFQTAAYNMYVIHQALK